MIAIFQKDQSSAGFNSEKETWGKDKWDSFSVVYFVEAEEVKEKGVLEVSNLKEGNTGA